MEIINIIKEFEGIVGALAGVIVTLVYTEYLKRRGKVVMYVVDKELKYHTYDNVGAITKGKDGSDFYEFRIKISLDVYNGSELPRVMRNVLLEFFVDKKCVHTVIPKDETTSRYTAGMLFHDYFSINNLMPREIQRVKLIGSVWEDDLGLIQEVNCIRMSYLDEKSKKKYCDLFSGDIKAHS